LASSCESVFAAAPVACFAERPEVERPVPGTMQASGGRSDPPHGDHRIRGLAGTRRTARKALAAAHPTRVERRTPHRAPSVLRRCAVPKPPALQSSCPRSTRRSA
jgi:hypothetical protein